LEGHKYYYGVESEQKYCEKVDPKVKTGLGSSAGMISSLIIALAYITGVATEGKYSEWPKPTKKLIGYLAQISNAVAQKKIGSGFDIASALNGNIVFKRKGDIEKSMNVGEIQGEDLEYLKFSLHPSLVVVLINMKSYADTRKMVKAVLDYVAIHSDKTEMFGTKSFRALNDVYNQITEQLQLPTLNAVKCRELTKQMHEMLYVVSNETNANILPDPSYLVLKQLMDIPSTIFCTVPGSGGPDAICALGTSISYLDDVKKVTGKMATQLKLRNGAKIIKMKTVV
jgi:phosphomevalonate kinase